MEYEVFEKTIRDRFDNVFAIHMKCNTASILADLLCYLENLGFSIVTGDSISVLDESYLKHYFEQVETDFITIHLAGNILSFNLFLEHQNSLSLWFNDAGEQQLDKQKFAYLKQLMADLATEYQSTVYFVNEGEADFRYKIFKYDTSIAFQSYDIENFTSCTERVG